MWTELKYCRQGDYIRAYFLGDSDIESSSNYTWHEIYTLENVGGGEYYAAIEGFKGGRLSGFRMFTKKFNSLFYERTKLLRYQSINKP